MVERGARSVDAIEERYRHDLERIQADFDAVSRRNTAIYGRRMTVHASIEHSGTQAALLATEEPTMRAGVVRMIDELKLYVATAGATPQ